jgi:hypothetical protein
MAVFGTFCHLQVIECIDIYQYVHALQSRLRRFDSDPRLHL